VDNVHSSRIHKVALVGPSGAGNTTLVESLLAGAGVLSRKGSVDDGTTACDVEPEAISRRSSVSLSIATFDVGEDRVHVLDTPGMADFVADVEIALAVADIVILVVSAVDGVGAHAIRLWRAAERAGVPRLVFVNKLDHDRADLAETLQQLRNACGDAIAPLELPIGQGSAFHGIADLLSETALTYDGGPVVRGPIPTELAELEAHDHEHLVEGIVVGDEALTEAYLDGRVPGPDELEATLVHELDAGEVIPVLVGSALRDIGVDRLASFVCEAAGPHGVRVRAGDVELEVTSSSNGNPLARVVKTTVDPFAGRLSVLEVLSGTIAPDTELVCTRTHQIERIHQMDRLVGKLGTPVTEARAGELVAVAKLHDVRVGDTLASKGTPVAVEPFDLTEPTHTVAVKALGTGDDEKLTTSLQHLVEEDAGLRLRRDEETHQILLSAGGDTHVQVALERLARKHHVAVELDALRVPYRQSAAKPAAAEGRIKKQTGGHGQFAVVHLRLEPTGRGSGYCFVDEVVGGAVPRQFVRAVDKGVRRAMATGGDLGFPVVDVTVILDDGKAHPVDSSEAAFEQAAALAFTEALREAGPLVLEPVSRLEVDLPATCLGDVLGDLNTRRAKVLASETLSTDRCRVSALVPTAEIARYTVELRTLTAGAGTFSAVADRYEPVPSGHLGAILAGADRRQA
jgi:elongation factor G